MKLFYVQASLKSISYQIVIVISKYLPTSNNSSEKLFTQVRNHVWGTCANTVCKFFTTTEYQRDNF